MTVGTSPVSGSRQGLQDGVWLLGLAGGTNRLAQSGLTAKAGGTKAAANQIPAVMEMVSFGTVAVNGDSALLPQAVKGTVLFVHNAGAATLSLYGNGNDRINGALATANYDIPTNTCAVFFCTLDGAWSAIKSA